jgi:hypothetical protein
MAYAFIAHTSAGWRAVYWFIFSIEAVSFTMVLTFYWPPSFKTKHQHDGKSKLDLLKAQDYLGLALFTAGLTLLLLGINWVRRSDTRVTRVRAGQSLTIASGGFNSPMEERVHHYANRDRSGTAGRSRCLVQVQHDRISTDPTSALSRSSKVRTLPKRNFGKRHYLIVSCRFPVSCGFITIANSLYYALGV